MQTGKVRWFDAQKGLGFIEPDDGGDDILVEMDALHRAGLADLAVGQKISYELFVDRCSGEFSAEQLRIFD